MNKYLNTKAMTDVITEMERQDQMWGDNHNPFLWGVTSLEEIGKATSSMMGGEFDGNLAEAARKNIIQVAAVALQILEYDDQKVSKKSPDMAYTAEIELIGFFPYDTTDIRANGRIYQDAEKRWCDGVEIITSSVQNIHSFYSDGYIRTRNSVYKIRRAGNE
ncbi:hypothetical protein KKJ25_05945 [Xenorhabdus bovienii]|uniref:hypothetical protein n=1 Tax=Xenorhabdus bovienii TaxID=40576 RepID=UPI00237C7647|nr:hypothetical protein [Xenorhabdus bovienii]MDE1494518.1 hypothetical protein [Xenorhabdus bovienii]MDE9472660.1 hypothetical protein [Xenorhabdus bovienii]MDE9533713.1 hypothetical protein [Xenorhabdus bovienii]